jgi:hypothetical protein
VKVGTNGFTKKSGDDCFEHVCHMRYEHLQILRLVAEYLESHRGGAEVQHL